MCQVIFQEKKEEIRHIGAKHGFINEILLEKNIKDRRIRMDKPSLTDGATCETPVNYSLKCEVSKCTIKIYISHITIHTVYYCLVFFRFVMTLPKI